jgi:hypothetical protein
VDSLFAFVPMLCVERLFYLPVELYHYLIGREGQSVEEKVMLGRLDQQARVARSMLEVLSATKGLDSCRRRYMVHHLDLVCVIIATLLLRSGRPEDLEMRRRFWQEMRGVDRGLYRRLRWGLLGFAANLPTWIGHRLGLAGYRWGRRRVGYT